MGVSTNRGIAATLPAAKSGGWASQPIAPLGGRPGSGQPWIDGGIAPNQLPQQPMPAIEPAAPAAAPPAFEPAGVPAPAAAPIAGPVDAKPSLFRPQPIIGQLDPPAPPPATAPAPQPAAASQPVPPDPRVAGDWGRPPVSPAPIGPLAQLGAGRLGMKGGDGFTDPIRALGGHVDPLRRMGDFMPGKPVGVAPRTRLF